LSRDKFLRNDLHERQIEKEIASHDPAGRQPAAGEPNDDALHSLDEMVVGEDVSCLVDDDPGPAAGRGAMLHLTGK
jgi:hypothetical protein